MAQETIQTRVELDESADLDLKKWARSEGRSKRNLMTILLRKLAALRKTDPDALASLGLLDRMAR
jgi:hypothetical protein